jgi:hypothetical protein
MKEFASVYGYQRFAEEVQRKNRFIRNKESEDFLDAVLETCQKRISNASSGGKLWRAQLGCDWRPEGEGEEIFEVPCGYRPLRMSPISEKTNEGRINPRRIAYLYIATDVETAIAEVRPWVGAYISIGQFEIISNLKLVDCTKDLRKGIIVYGKEPSPEEREKAVWEDINRAFSYPIGPGDDFAAYVSTQIIGELFKINGFDGIIYRSSLGPGQNICLFNLDAAKMVFGTLYYVTGVKYNFVEEESERYWVRE